MDGYLGTKIKLHRIIIIALHSSFFLPNMKL